MIKWIASSPRFYNSKLREISSLVIVLLGLYLFLNQLWQIHLSWTPVAYVDGWPAYDRLMQWSQGHISLGHYLFNPQGPHLHFIIYFLYLLDVTFGSGRQILPHIATLLSIIGLTVTFTFLFLPSRSRIETLSPHLLAVLVAVFIQLSSVSEATVIPFQAVVVVSRFSYVLLLAVLLRCQLYPNRCLHLTALAISCLAVSFFGSGVMFALEVVLLHAVFFRGWRLLACSLLPLASYIWLMSEYVPPAAEATTAVLILRHLNFKSVSEILLGSLCYYGTPLVNGWPQHLNVSFGRSEIVLLIISFLVCSTTVIWGVRVLVSVGIKAYRVQSIDRLEYTSCLMALLSLFVFASAFSAAILWVARARIFGAALGMPAHFAVLTSNRYETFASLAFIVFLFISLNLKNRRLGLMMSMSTLIVVACGSLNVLNDHDRFDVINRNRIEAAATGIMMGISPAQAEASAVWPGVSADWYWPNELKKTADYIQRAGISYAYRMPTLGQSSEWPQAKIYGVLLQTIPDGTGLCRLSGSEISVRESLFNPQRFFPITTMSREVVGFAARSGGTVTGHLTCGGLADLRPLFLSIPN